MKSARDTKQDLRKELNAQLEKLIEQRNKLDPAFTEKMTKWNNLTKDISTLEGRIAFEKNQAQMAKQNKEENARRDIQKQREDEEKSNEQQEREERQREAERKQEERLAELEARRAAAIAAHRKAQARFTTASGPGQWGGASTSKKAAVPVEETVEVAVDRFAEEKGVCRQLMALCESLKPTETQQSGGKKKKRRRRKKKVTFSAHQFGLFGRVGVNPPKNITGLGDTISELEAKIEEYDNTPEEAEEAPAPEVPAVETEEEPQVCAAAESTEL